MLKPPFDPGERPALPGTAVLQPKEPVVPPQRSFWQRFLERKFLVALLLSLGGILALVSGAVSFSTEVLLVIVSPILVWLGAETLLDARRLKVADRPGALDDVARALLGIGAHLAEGMNAQAARDEARAQEVHDALMANLRGRGQANPEPPEDSQLGVGA